MNFGWEGQGDAYYSLTNLNVTETGSEFQGKPLAFNRALTAILAHPNNGKYPDIDRGLLETSPQLMFNEGGSLSIKGADKTFNPSQTQTVEISSFVNRGNPFRGDIGVAVYDAQGKFVRVAYSDDHATGGLTQRIYGDGLDGYMGTDYLINEPQPIHLSIAQLADGYYRLIAVCTARKDDGSWDDFFPIKKAPIIEVELSNGSARISEICSEEARFQLMGQPRLSDEAYQGEKVVAFFPVKNLNGVPRDCYLRVRLLDADRTVVLDTRVDALTEIEGFTETEIPITLSIPASLVPARYEVQLEMTGDEAETLHYPSSTSTTAMPPISMWSRDRTDRLWPRRRYSWPTTPTPRSSREASTSPGCRSSNSECRYAQPKDAATRATYICLAKTRRPMRPSRYRVSRIMSASIHRLMCRSSATGCVRATSPLPTATPIASMSPARPTATMWR